MNSKRNIIWFLIDGARNYATPDDPLKMGRPPICDELAEEGIDFLSTVTSATSSAMSLMSYLTSISSYYFGLTYEGFFKDDYAPKSLVTILKNYGYQIYSICVGADLRRDRWLREMPHVPKVNFSCKSGKFFMLYLNKLFNLSRT